MTDNDPITKLEHMTAPEGYAFASKRLVKNCKSCRWYQTYSGGMKKKPPKNKSKACMRVLLDDKGMVRLDKLTGIPMKGEHWGKRVEPYFSCDGFFGKSMPLVKIKEDAL